MAKFILSLFLLIPTLGFSQIVLKEIIPIDTLFTSYSVIYKETVGDFYKLKRAVFANDTNTVAIEKNFSNGHQNGLTRIYYPSGKLMIRAIYENDQLQGDWTWFDENGIIITKGEYNQGTKDGFWAYKSVKTYGRYNKGLKHRVWKKKDLNNQKYKAFYWKGKLKYGSNIFNENYLFAIDSSYTTHPSNADNDTMEQINKITVEEHYLAVLKYIAKNYYLRKVTKDYFRPLKKERNSFINKYIDLDQDVFRFAVSPNNHPIDINYFLAHDKLTKPSLDSLIKTMGVVIQKELMSAATNENLGFSNYSTDNKSSIILFLSIKSNNIVAVDMVEYPIVEPNIEFIPDHNNPDVTPMKILFLIGPNNEILEVEYQK